MRPSLTCALLNSALSLVARSSANLRVAISLRRSVRNHAVVVLRGIKAMKATPQSEVSQPTAYQEHGWPVFELDVCSANAVHDECTDDLGNAAQGDPSGDLDRMLSVFVPYACNNDKCR